MDDKPAFQKHEAVLKDTPVVDTKDDAGDLSRAMWEKKAGSTATVGSVLAGAATEGAVAGTDRMAGGISKLGFPNAEFDLGAGADAAGAKLQAKHEKTAIGEKAADAPVDGRNPLPETWKYDDAGNLLEAGDRVKASYDKGGNLQKVQVDDATYERQGKDVLETYKGNDGKMHTHLNKDVDSFTLKTEDNYYKGAYKSIIMNDGNHSLTSKIWESPEHTAAIDKIWKAEAQREADVAKSTPDNPHPDTWKYGPDMKVLQAGDRFSAQYDAKGELQSAKMGDDEWKRGPDNTVIHTHKRKDGTTDTDITTGVTKFTAEKYAHGENGLLAGMTVEVAEGTSSSAKSSKLYANEESVKTTNDRFRNWGAEVKE